MRPSRPHGYLEPGDDRAADQLLATIMSQTPVPQRRSRTRRRMWVAIGIVSAACAGSGAAAVLNTRDAQNRTARMCLSESSINRGEQLAVDPSAPDPISQCRQAWTDGLIGDGTPPPATLTVCVTADDTTAVVPGGPDVCVGLGWSPAAPATEPPDRSGELAGILSERFTDHCYTSDEAAVVTRHVLADLELDNWDVDDRTTRDDWCTAPAVDPTTHTIILSSYEQ